jgi:hypothetical protein
MAYCPRCSLNPVLFGVVVALAFVLVVTTLYSQNTTATIGSFLSKQDFGERITDVDIAEAVEAEVEVSLSEDRNCIFCFSIFSYPKLATK